MRVREFILFLLLGSVLPAAAHAAAAVAIDSQANRVGYCRQKATIELAKQCAMSNCQRVGGIACVVKGADNQGVYGALAMGRGVAGFTIGYHENEGQEMASQYALQDCHRAYANKANCDEDDSRCQAASGCAIKATWKDFNPSQSAFPSASRPGPNPEAKAWNAKGQALLREKRFDEAAGLFTRALEIDPHFDSALNNRGICLTEMSSPNYEAARRDYDEAIRLNPQNKVFYFNRAILDRKMGRRRDYMNDMTRAAQLGNGLAIKALSAMHQPQGMPQNQTASPAPAAPAYAPTAGGYQTCNIPSGQIANVGGRERPTNPAYNSVCLSILPPTCRNWVVDHQPCAYRPCVVGQNLNRCPNGEPTSYVAKQTVPFTKADFAKMDAEINAQAAKQAQGTTPGGQGLNQAQINAYETMGKLMWNSTGNDMVYKNVTPWGP